MVNLLIGIHAFLGELGIACFIWIFVEMLKPNPERVKRAKIVATLGILFFFASWFSGGYYYVNYYGDDVKPTIKEGPQPWAHQIFTETKEHIFLFLPFLSIFAFSLISRFEKELAKDKNQKARKSILTISSIIIIIGALMALMGYIISSGFRASLEAGI